MTRRGPQSVIERVDFGEAELVRDPQRPAGWTLFLDRAPQSYVDMADPTRLDFWYVRRLATVIDAASPSSGRLRVLHLGGGALTLPRYVAATHAGAVQRVVERDAALTALVRRVLPLPRGADIRVRIADARAAVAASAPGRFHAVIADVYSGTQVPGRLTTTEFAAAVARLLTPDGLYAANVVDAPPPTFARSQVASLRQVFAQVCLVAPPGALRGRRPSNLVLVAAAGGGRLPLARLAAVGAADPASADVRHGRSLDRFVAGARPVTDATAVDSPEPPRSLFGPHRGRRNR